MENENIVPEEQAQPLNEEEVGQVKEAINQLEEQAKAPQEEKPVPLVGAPEVNAEEIALETAEELTQDNDGIVTLSTGYRVRYRSVSPNVIYGVQAKILDPDPPLQDHPSGSGAKVPNPEHPDYKKALRETELKRAEAIQNALFIFGLKLVDPLPEDDDWLEDCVLAGLIDEEEIEGASAKKKELWFKKYKVADNSVYVEISKGMNVSEEGIAQVSAAFKSNAPRSTD